MNEPTRLHADPESELERSLLDAGRSYQASAAARARALSALGVVGVTASTSAAASTLSKAGIAKIALTAALLGGAALPVWRYVSQRPVAAVRVAPSAPAVVAVAAPVASAATLPPPSRLEVAPSAASAAPAHVEPRPASRAALSAELAALDAARAALSRGDADTALATLDAYARDFPRGKLSLEAEVLRIDALAKSGQTAAARQRAAAFLKRHPDSVLAARVRGYLEL